MTSRISVEIGETEQLYAPFWDHVEELRYTFLWMLGIIGLGMIICFVYYHTLIEFLIIPFQNSSTGLYEERLESIRISNKESQTRFYSLPHDVEIPITLPPGLERIAPQTYQLAPNSSFVFSKRMPTHSLMMFSPLEGMLVALKISFWAGLTLTSPFWLFAFLRFIAPALRKEEKGLIWPFLGFSIAFIMAGCALAYLVTIPIANSYLAAFNQSIGQNLWSLSAYLDYTLFLLLANAIAFELCAVGIFAVHLNLISHQFLRRSRRAAVVLAFILGALLTPPDVLTQFMLALPLIALYEVIVFYARLKQKVSPL